MKSLKASILFGWVGGVVCYLFRHDLAWALVSGGCVFVVCLLWFATADL